MISDPVLDALHEHINDIADMCNANIKPWEPDAGPRAVRLFNELAKPYIDAMCEYAWCNCSEDLVPVGDINDYLD